METTLRSLMLDRIRQHLIHNSAYGDYLQRYADPFEQHRILLASLASVTDRMLLSLYTRLERDPNFFVVCVDRPDFLSIRCGRYFGGMSENGEVHT